MGVLILMLKERAEANGKKVLSISLPFDWYMALARECDRDVVYVEYADKKLQRPRTIGASMRYAGVTVNAGSSALLVEFERA